MKRQITLMILAMVLIPFSALARNYSATFKNSDAQTTLEIITKATGYDFVYQSGLLESVKEKVTGTYKDVSLDDLLNQTLYSQLGLNYKIIDKSISLSKAQRKAIKRKVTGTVSDEEGEPLAGASVMIEGTANGVATDLDGNFQIDVDGDNQVLAVSYIGMRQYTLHLNDRNTSKPLKIVLAANTNLMDEVVVTGYQNIKRENATGAYQTITAEDMDRRYSGSLVDNLEGKVPGLVTYNNGVKKGEEAMTIRGTSSIQATTKPLVVVDGLPIEGSIETVNPYDIANITVLKDAAAAAIYGARASNGVIVITTKRAVDRKMSVDFNADITITEKNNYDNMGWASSAELIELEKYNFEWISKTPNSPQLRNLANYYNNPTRRFAMQPVMREMYANYVGDISDTQLKETLERYSRNDYRSEWQNAFEKSRVLQQYNFGLRYQGAALMSNLMVNYKTDNLGMINDRQNVITLKYSGEWIAASCLKINFGMNVISERAKTDILRPSITSYSPYYSLYNQDGSLADLTLGFDDNVPAIKNPAYGLKSMFYNPVKEEGLGLQRTRRTNIRSYINGVFTILPGWTASGYFQYEDIQYKSNTYRDPESYSMRRLYNLYTRESNGSVTHNIPEGGRLDTQTSDGAFWTFRAQSQYRKTFMSRHEIDILGGFEFRESRTKEYSNVLIGYDDQTQTNQNINVNWRDLERMNGTASVMGTDYRMGGAPNESSFSTSDILHRFYSLYATANYVYDGRYALSGSWRIDKTDLFGADPKFRGRPLWSAGASWNAHNETFMKDLTWINALKPRISYGLTGNIDSSVSSYLTASISVNSINQGKQAWLNTPPNDQLRWEKTSTWNFGVDFSVLDYRLNGSIDYYHKKGTDLLTYTDLDPETGWSMLMINNGNMINNGLEIQLNSQIIRPRGRNTLGVNLGINFSYNNNRVTKVSHQATSGYEALNPYNLKKNKPVHSIYSFDFAGLKQNGQIQNITWRDKTGEIHTGAVTSSEFTPDDVVFSGALDPKYTGSFVPEITYRGFSLSAMASYYGGHVMRVNTQDYTAEGSKEGYNIPSTLSAIPSSYLNYWRTGDSEKYMANGAPGEYVVGKFQSHYMNSNVVPADYIKLRNIVIGYTLPQSFTKKAGINQLRLRLQLNNVATWVKNNADKDPEAVNPVTGSNLTKTPRSYTFGLLLNL